MNSFTKVKIRYSKNTEGSNSKFLLMNLILQKKENSNERNPININKVLKHQNKRIF
jgi:hypothetical protein